MLFSEIKEKVGKKVYKVTQARNQQRTHTVIDCIDVYILDINEVNNTVLAAVGKGMPAQWYDKKGYLKWKADRPEQQRILITKKTR